MYALRSISLVLILNLVTTLLTGDLNAQTFEPPLTQQVPSSINYSNDTNIIDQYRWLENFHDSIVTNWFTQQNQSFVRLMKQLSERNILLAEWQHLDSLKTETITQIDCKKNRNFFIKTLPGEDFGKFYLREGRLGTDILLFDPYKLHPETKYSIQYFTPSEDGSKVAIALTQGGTESARIFTLDIKTKKLSKESIYPCRFGVHDWTMDNTSYFYTAQRSSNIEAPNYSIGTRSMLHRVGTDPATDIELFSSTHNPEFPIDSQKAVIGFLSFDHKYLINALTSVSHKREAYYSPVNQLYDKRISWKRLFSLEDEVLFFEFANDSVYFESNKNAPHSKILAISAANPDIANARVVIAEDSSTIKQIYTSASYLFIQKNDGLRNFVLQYEFATGKITEIIPPEPGSLEISTFGQETDDVILTLSTYTKPPRMFDFNAKTGKCTKSVFDRSIDYPGMENMVEKEVEVTARDGVKIPLTIIYPKGIKLDGSSYCLLEGYGAYGTSYVTTFSLRRLVLNRHNIVYAFAHIRGGGEKGEAWHQAGMKKTKPNSWKDFIDCAEYLIREKYTDSTRLVAEGGSAGGITIGRAITERPGLFGAAIITSGEMNPLLAEFESNGPVNIPEFGTVKNQSDCKALIEMDPLYHIKKGVKYPAVICLIGMNDARVVPWASGKFIAAL
jgi:prolyl oligopeptidase